MGSHIEACSGKVTSGGMMPTTVVATPSMVTTRPTTSAVAAESPLPQVGAEDRHRHRAGAIVRGIEVAAAASGARPSRLNVLAVT